MAEQLHFLCHPSLNWLLLRLSKWPSSNLHVAISFSIQLPMMLLHCGMYCYKLVCNWGNNWMSNIISYDAALNSFVTEQQGDRVVFVHLMLGEKKKKASGCECLLDNRRHFPFVSICLASPLSYRYKNPRLHLLALAPTAHQTRPIRA